MSVILLMGAVFATYATIPRQNCDLQHFDAILVLGSPTLIDGQPSPEERERADEGVREFKAGRADHIIFSGGATMKRFVEGRSMAEIAVSEGVPSSAIVIEDKARNTIQNIYFSDQIMRQRGWNSVEVVSSSSHLPRTALILKLYSLQWKEHAARWPPEYGWFYISRVYAAEMLGTFVLRWFGFWPSPFLPGQRTSE